MGHQAIRLILLLLFSVPALAQYAPLNLSLTNPKPVGGTAGNGTLWSSTTRNASALPSTGTNRFAANYFSLNDSALDTSANYGTDLNVELTIGAVTGSRAAGRFFTTVNAPTGNLLPTANTYGTLNANIICNGNDNGTGLTTTTAHGGCGPFNFISQLGSTATNWYQIGGEIDVVMQFGSSAVVSRGLQIAHTSPSKAQGTQEDYALGIGSAAPEDTFSNVAITDSTGDFSCTCSNVQVGDTIKIAGTNTGGGSISGYVNPTTYYVIATNHTSTFQLGDITSHVAITTTAGTPVGLVFNDTWDNWGWNTGFAIPCGPPCANPMNRNGSLIAAEQATTVAHILDFHRVTCSTDALTLGSGFAVDCSGNITTAGNIVADNGSATMKLGNTSGTDTGPIAIGNVGNNVNFPGLIQFATGTGIAANAWADNGLWWKGASITNTGTDNTTTGTINSESFLSLPTFTLAAGNGNTPTANQVNTLYIPAPACGAGFSCGSLNSLRLGGNLSGIGGAVISGALIALNAGSNNNVNINTGVSTGTTTIGAGSATLVVAAATSINVNNNQATNIGTGTTTSNVTIGASSAANSVIIKGAPVNINTAAADTGTISIGNSSTTGKTVLNGITTGTNADFLCLSASGAILLQTSACTISSARYKDIIGGWVGSATSAVNKLQVVRFMLKPSMWSRDENSRSIQAGLTAENVAATVPDCAVYESDMYTPKSYRQECVIALLVKAQQESGQQLFLMKLVLAGALIFVLWSLYGRRTA